MFRFQMFIQNPDFFLASKHLDFECHDGHVTGLDIAIPNPKTLGLKMSNFC